MLAVIYPRQTFHTIEAVIEQKHGIRESRRDSSLTVLLVSVCLKSKLHDVLNLDNAFFVVFFLSLKTNRSQLNSLRNDHVWY
jgi:hypothetical protein